MRERLSLDGMRVVGRLSTLQPGPVIAVQGTCGCILLVDGIQKGDLARIYDLRYQAMPRHVCQGTLMNTIPTIESVATVTSVP